ncbi:transposase [Weissella coleopterorum]|uniref:Transposase n=1 Tax=Weissella coleopterorum TaxID=2714949 RepID=A0A6G8AYH7_9LACO|nr:helix-turn-helix domain-containing protein [Weissella coleopterorum]QIL50019.1 transposase [Weissella coleopterorum]
MTKYTNKFKELVVRECLENSKTLSQIARNFNIPSQKTLRTWINQWRDPGTFERSVYQYYSADFKITVLQYTETHTYIEAVSEFGLNTNSIISRWRN